MADVLRYDKTNQGSLVLNTLNQSRQVSERFAACVRELSLANQALKKNLAAYLANDGVREVVTRNEQMEINVQQCADDLQVVHATLAEEMSKRSLLEQQLSENEQQAEKHRYLAFHDVLTGLANRALFNDRLERALAQAQRHSRSLAVLFIDVNKFKLINDTYGHDIGDKVLQIVGARLRACVREEDTVARIGGDEFMCLLMDVNEDAAIARIAASMIATISEACGLIFTQFPVRPSIGIAIFPDDGISFESLMKGADAAMYKAKADGAGYCFFKRPLHRTG